MHPVEPGDGRFVNHGSFLWEIAEARSEKFTDYGKVRMKDKSILFLSIRFFLV